MKKIILTEDQAMKILDYLMDKSWKEVNPLIVMINNACVEDGGNNGNVQKV